MFERVCIIAEVGSNHNGDLDTAMASIRLAKAAGADVVKFQLFTADGLAHIESASYKTLRKYALPRQWLPTLKQYADRMGIGFTATPFDLEAVELLDKLDVPFIKVSSGDLTYHDLIRKAAVTKKPLVISTGAASVEEIVATGSLLTNRTVVWLQCVIAYPASPEQLNLRSMRHLCPWAKHLVGLSDHTLSTALPAVAVGMGARVIEKHFTPLTRSATGPDHPHSLMYDELRLMVRNIREAEDALGTKAKQPLADEMAMRLLARRGWYAKRDLPAGHVLTADDLLALRPVAGVPVEEAIVGLTLAQAVSAMKSVKREAISRG